MNNNDIIILSLHNRNLLLPQQHSWLVAPNVVAEQLLAATGLIPSDFSFFFCSSFFLICSDVFFSVLFIFFIDAVQLFQLLSVCTRCCFQFTH